MGSFATIGKTMVKRRSALVLVFMMVACLYAPFIQARFHASDTIAPIANDAVDTLAMKLLVYDAVFTENWITDVAFVYDNIRATDLPETVSIPLVRNGEQFRATWYGKISSGYKMRWGRHHHGVDIGLKTGDPVFAAWDGVVRYAQWNKAGYGNCVIIRHKNGLETVHGHLSKIHVRPNQYVTSGDTIGLGGSTGRSTGPHLHFEVRYKDFSIDPELLIDYNSQTLRADTFTLLRSNIRGNRYSIERTSIESNLPASDSLSIKTGTIIDSSKQQITVGSETKKPDFIQITPVVQPEKTTNNTTKKETTGKKTPAKKLPKTYTIRKGDTYSSISKKTGVPIATLRKLNPKQKETRLMPGKLLRIR